MSTCKYFSTYCEISNWKNPSLNLIAKTKHFSLSSFIGIWIPNTSRIGMVKLCPVWEYSFGIQNHGLKTSPIFKTWLEIGTDFSMFIWNWMHLNVSWIRASSLQISIAVARIPNTQKPNPFENQRFKVWISNGKKKNGGHFVRFSNGKSSVFEW